MDNKQNLSKHSKKFTVLVYALLITLLINVLFYSLLRENAKSEFQQVGNALTKEVSQSLKMWISEQRKMAGIVALSAPISEWAAAPADEIQKTQVTRYLRMVLGRYNQFENISISRFKNPNQPWKTPENGAYALEGYEVGTDSSAIVAFEDTGTVEPILDGKSYYISSIMKSSISGKPIFYFSIPLTRNNEILGVITFSVKMSYFTESIIEPVRYKNTGYLFFIDDRGETIAHANASYVLSNEAYLTEIVNQLLSPLKLGENYFRGKFSRGVETLLWQFIRT